MRKSFMRRTTSLPAKKPVRRLNPSHGENETLRGEIIDDVKMYGTSGWGFTWLFDVESQEEVKISGTLEGYSRGHLVMIEGKWNQHQRWGFEVQVSKIWEDAPGTEGGILKWLDDHLPQIGPVRAQALVDTFGASLWETIEKEPQRLIEINGITQERVDDIARAYEKYREDKKVVLDLYDIGLNQREVRAARKALGPEVVEHVNANPYVLFEHEKIGFTWHRVEKLAEGRVAWNDPNRLRAALLYTMQSFASEGHTAVDVADIENAFTGVVGVATDVLSPLSELTALGRITIYEGYYMLSVLDKYEGEIADRITELLTPTEEEDDVEDRRAARGDEDSF